MTYRRSLVNFFVLLASFVVPSLAQYTLKDHFQGSNFFDAFNFFNGHDPTNGFVNYVDRKTAEGNKIISASDKDVYLGVDWTSKLDPAGSQGGRQSTRLESKNKYNGGLFIGDFGHMPGGICGVWPAFWTFGPNWPFQGEIDILEGVNVQGTNLMTLHTGEGCTTAGADQSADLLTSNCWQQAPDQDNSGCGNADKTAASYSEFNQNGGGVYAMEWTDSAIKIWFFPRSIIPQDISSGKPKPSSWGTPAANFQGGCDIPSHFSDHRIIFDTTFCGDWAGAVFASDPKCGDKGDCQTYVAQNPEAFKEAYWTINYVSVYTAPEVKQLSLLALPDKASDNQPAAKHSVAPAAETNPAQADAIAHNAAGATGTPPAPGVKPPAEVKPKKIDQEIATANETESG
ncbi:MAG: hypothetical protein M1831_006937 [Alyxoria varia]|nr:MAG: hypothetical protein M1831_006937 [Alyxoria varia]